MEEGAIDVLLMKVAQVSHGGSDGVWSDLVRCEGTIGKTWVVSSRTMWVLREG